MGMVEYLPSFFTTKPTLPENKSPVQQEPIPIPLNPLRPAKPHFISSSITIFGFSQNNLPNILEQLEMYKPYSIEYNTNYLVIICEESKYREILKWNRKVFNEEII